MAKKKTANKKAPASKKKAVTKKAATKKAATKKAATKKAVTKKAATKKAVTKKAETKKKVTKKVAKKSGRRKIDLANPKSVAAAALNCEVDAQGYVFVNGRRVRAISTKGMVQKKKPRTPKVEPVVKEKKVIDVTLIKTKMPAKELNAYRDLLLDKRRTIVGMVSGLENEALRSNGGNLSNMPIHMADVGSDVFEQDFTLGMAETERGLLIEIDKALERIERKTYGVCQATGKPIPKARLKAKPWAQYTIEAARQNERSIPTE